MKKLKTPSSVSRPLRGGSQLPPGEARVLIFYGLLTMKGF